MAKIPGEVVYTPPKPKPVRGIVGPQNIGLPTYRPGDANNPTGTIPWFGPPTTPAAPAAAAAPPPTPDFNALALSDAQYTTGKNQLEQQNTLTLEQLLKGYRGQAQGYQDQANSRGALFSGAAVNAQRSAAQGYADQQRQQALNKQGAEGQLYQTVFQRLVNQLAGGS